ncbi:succinate dehydrogenase cytochrome b560 subunit, mitochondrial-like [Nymphalis io]|uniref:succinate dehydrogenase cytochrome b560 subunit, mitochondrial-like n=1 Tax=Inachis io TaxID=171585 RepID=UPI002168D32F|nr:succinate dehydrogenase cytochrome b560 subunit, mitochondrial-like [Nymphalis io]
MFPILLKARYFRENVALRILNNNGSLLFPSIAYFNRRVVCSGKNTCCDEKSGTSNSHRIMFQPYVPPPKKSHDDKNMSLNRPMSPHLTIYAPTLPAMTSIVQRITGIIVTFYALLLSGGSLFLSNGVETYVSMIQSLDLSRPLIFIIKIILGAPFVYHYFNGIRFCMWNAGRWLAMKDVYETARKSFIATAVVTLLFALL